MDADQTLLLEMENDFNSSTVVIIIIIIIIITLT